MMMMMTSSQRLLPRTVRRTQATRTAGIFWTRPSTACSTADTCPMTALSHSPSTFSAYWHASWCCTISGTTPSRTWCTNGGSGGREGMPEPDDLCSGRVAVPGRVWLHAHAVSVLLGTGCVAVALTGGGGSAWVVVQTATPLETPLVAPADTRCRIVEVLVQAVLVLPSIDPVGTCGPCQPALLTHPCGGQTSTSSPWTSPTSTRPLGRTTALQRMPVGQGWCPPRTVGGSRPLAETP